MVGFEIEPSYSGLLLKYVYVAIVMGSSIIAEKNFPAGYQVEIP